MNNSSLIEKGYMICGSPRSGSTLLCDLLKQTGVAGYPESYFRPESIIEYSSKWGLSNTSEDWDNGYLQTVINYANKSTGCLGIRMMWSNFPEFLERLKKLHPQYNNDQRALRETIFIDRFIHISRHDKIAQAISLVTANQTGLWHRSSDGTERQRTKPPEKPFYSYQQIAEALEMIELEANGWKNWFNDNDISPLVITYEELALDPQSIVDKIMNYLGLNTLHEPKVTTAKMATSINKAWADRFRRESTKTNLA